MRHKKLGRQFSRNTSHRRAMFRALTANLILHDRIETTDAKAKELRRVVERLITRACRLGEAAYTPAEKLSPADVARRNSTKRMMARFLQRYGVKVDGSGETIQVDLLEKVLVQLAARYKERPGGYTRIIKIGRRRGDNAPMCLIELVEEAVAAKPAAGEAAEATPEAAPAAG